MCDRKTNNIGFAAEKLFAATGHLVPHESDEVDRHAPGLVPHFHRVDFQMFGAGRKRRVRNEPVLLEEINDAAPVHSEFDGGKPLAGVPDTVGHEPECLRRMLPQVRVVKAEPAGTPRCRMLGCQEAQESGRVYAAGQADPDPVSAKIIGLRKTKCTLHFHILKK